MTKTAMPPCLLIDFLWEYFAQEAGARLESGLVEPTGDPERPLSDTEIEAKFHAYADPVVGAARAGRIRAAVDAIEGGGLGALCTELGAPGPASEAARPAPE